MRCVVFGDIHLFSLRMNPKRLLLSKRLLGVSNLILFRRRAFNHSLLPKLIEQAIELDPDIALFTGDVTTTSLESEFRDFREAIEPLVDIVDHAVYVPGNHDRYTYGSHREARLEEELKGIVPDKFPDVRTLAPGWKLLSLDPVIPQKMHARGRLGAVQFERAAEIIRHVGPEEGLIVLCHYPCAYPRGTIHAASHDMAEDVKLRKLLDACPGRVIYLHGHIHKPWVYHPGDDNNVPFVSINVGSPCMINGKHPRGHGFFSFELPDDIWGDLKIEQHVLPEDFLTKAARAVAPEEVEEEEVTV